MRTRPYALQPKAFATQQPAYSLPICRDSQVSPCSVLSLRRRHELVLKSGDSEARGTAFWATTSAELSSFPIFCTSESLQLVTADSDLVLMYHVDDRQGVALSSISHCKMHVLRHSKLVKAEHHASEDQEEAMPRRPPLCGSPSSSFSWKRPAGVTRHRATSNPDLQQRQPRWASRWHFNELSQALAPQKISAPTTWEEQGGRVAGAISRKLLCVIDRRPWYRLACRKICAVDVHDTGQRAVRAAATAGAGGALLGQDQHARSHPRSLLIKPGRADEEAIEGEKRHVLRLVKRDRQHLERLGRHFLFVKLLRSHRLPSCLLPSCLPVHVCGLTSTREVTVR